MKAAQLAFCGFESSFGLVGIFLSAESLDLRVLRLNECVGSPIWGFEAFPSLGGDGAANGASGGVATGWASTPLRSCATNDTKSSQIQYWAAWSL